MKILSVFGTRPEAIKMAPVLRALSGMPEVTSVVCVTGQHRDMLQQVHDVFGIVPDYDLDVMVPGQSVNALCAAVVEKLDDILASERPDYVIVHGDTSSAMSAAMAAFHHRIPVAHVEAGLRTGSLHAPWPEEFNRRTIDMVSDYLFAPTAGAAYHLQQEKAAGKIIVTGNTVVDALHMVQERLHDDPALQATVRTGFTFLRPGAKLVLVTSHRRENLGQGLRDICTSVSQLAQDPSLDIVWPLHLNPAVYGPVREMLGQYPHVHLMDPLDYVSFVYLMQCADVILTDSGGIQEEAPALGKPVVVMRDVTERPDAVGEGGVYLAGTDPALIVPLAQQLLEQGRRTKVTRCYGDGAAAQRIACALTGREYKEFSGGREMVSQK